VRFILNINSDEGSALEPDTAACTDEGLLQRS